MKRTLLIAAFALVVVIPFVFMITAYQASYGLIKRGLAFEPPVATQIYDTNGALIAELFEENRVITRVKDIPDKLKWAFVAAEDQNFYRHGGIDLPGIMRALLVDILSGSIKQGGSTISQQLAKQVYTGSKRTLYRKMVELFIAMRIEQKYSKNKILEMYLNQIYFGHGAYGAASAARFYFEKDLKDISIVEAALLAALPSAPARYSPIKYPRRAFNRQKQVLFTMVNAGYVSKDKVVGEFNDFWRDYLEKIRLRYPTLGIRSRRFDKAPWFTEYIRRILVAKYGEERVYREGLRVYTTLDIRQQKAAQEAVSRAVERQNPIARNANRWRLSREEHAVLRKVSGLKRSDRKGLKRLSRLLVKFREELADTALLSSFLFGTGPIINVFEQNRKRFERTRGLARVQGALIALDPRNGMITAMVGGADFNSRNQLNRVVQMARQPGSSFKAFVYGAAIESKKITAGTPFLDAPVLFRGTRTTWAPSNYEKSFHGRVLVRRALALSLNIISVLIADRTGADKVAKFASKLTGVPLKRFHIDPTIALGTTELSPYEMARGFAVYANRGRQVNPYSIKYVLDQKGRKIYTHPVNGTGKQLVSREGAFIMTSLMRSVVDSGTATGAVRRGAGFNLPAAGKTGTNTRFRDAWFVGYTPDLVAAVWLGCDSQRYTLGRGQSAAAVAAPAWGHFMRQVYTFRKPARFPGPPPGVRRVRICSKSGKLPIDGCPVRAEYFRAGTAPHEKCDGAHEEMMSVFELAKKRKGEILEKEKLKFLKKMNEKAGEDDTDDNR